MRKVGQNAWQVSAVELRQKAREIAHRWGIRTPEEAFIAAEDSTHPMNGTIDQSELKCIIGLLKRRRLSLVEVGHLEEKKGKKKR